MKYQVWVLKEIIKRNRGGFGIYFLFLFSISIMHFLSSSFFNLQNLEALLGVFSFSEASYFELSWCLFQLFFLLYVTYLFYFYEIEHSPEFIFLRVNTLSLILKKFVLFSLFVLFFRILVYLIVFIIFKHYSFFTLTLFLKSVSLPLFIVLVFFLFSIFRFLFYQFQKGEKS